MKPLVRPAYWHIEPEKYLGRDRKANDYWLYRGNVYKTSQTGTEMQHTSIACMEIEWEDYQKFLIGAVEGGEY